jgi:hypothetical protein
MVSRGRWPPVVALVLLEPACVLSSFDAVGKSCSASEPCPAPFVCVLQGAQGVCTTDPCAGNPLLGLPCDAGMGVCVRSGSYACSAQPGEVTATPVTCNAVPGQPDAEVCNGLDDDCDGVVDDHLTGAPPCELDAGVCAGARHACIDGGFEPTCTALSYGTLFQAIETLCDGLDNDCDGRVDMSWPVPLGSPADGFSWRNDGTGLQAVFTQGTAVYWSRFDLAFHPIAGPVRLSDAGEAAQWPVITSGGQQGLVAWVERVADGGQRVRLGQVGDTGVLSWAGAAGTVETPASVGVPPSLTLDATGTTAVVAWIGDGGWPATSWAVPLTAVGSAPPQQAAGFPTPGPLSSVDVSSAPIDGDGGSLYDIAASSQLFGPTLAIERYDLGGNFVCAVPTHLGGMTNPIIFSNPRLASGVALYGQTDSIQPIELMWFAYDCAGTSEPEVLSADATGTALGVAPPGACAAWQALDGGVWAAFLSSSAVVGPVSAFPAGFESPAVTWGGAPYVSLAASRDGGMFGEHVCASGARP